MTSFFLFYVTCGGSGAVGRHPSDLKMHQSAVHVILYRAAAGVHSHEETAHAESSQL